MSRELRGVVDQDGISAQGVCVVASTNETLFFGGEILSSKHSSCCAFHKFQGLKDHLLVKIKLSGNLFGIPNIIFDSPSRISNVLSELCMNQLLGSSKRTAESRQVSNLIHFCSSINHFRPQCLSLHPDTLNSASPDLQIRVCLKIWSPRWLSHEISHETSLRLVLWWSRV